MNTTIKTGFATVFLLAISCTKENIHNSSSGSTQSKDNSIAAHYIGERFGGGIIFYIDSTGEHGLIADTVDFNPSTWWNGLPRTLTGAMRTKIGSGYSNTKKIVSVQGDSGRYAARRCWLYRGSGYTDWFLPSRDELNELYKQKSVVGLTGSRYWSSTEINLYRAWCQNDNLAGYNNKFTKNDVRAIRGF